MHRRHPALLGSLAAFALVLLSAPAALAGGWAVTTLDELPASMNAGETYAVGYTIRQHGVTPLTTNQSAIEIRNGQSGAVTRFPGQANGAQGHYVAQVVFPNEGEWQWSADQSPFEPQSLGAVTIVAAPIVTPATIAPTPEPASEPTILRVALPPAMLLATFVFAWRLRAFVRRPRAARATR